MQEKKTHTVVVNKFTHKFTGSINSLTSTNNPYVKKIQEIVEKENLPKYCIPNTKIFVNGDSVTFTFNWVHDIESKEDDKKVILAYIGTLPNEKNKKIDFLPVFIKIKEGMLKTYIFDNDEFKNDFKVSKDAVKLKVNEEIKYINSLEIDFVKRYSKDLIELIKRFEDYEVREEDIKTFLNMDKVKAFILEEEAQTIGDSSPREVLIDWYTQEFGRDY